MHDGASQQDIPVKSTKHRPVAFYRLRTRLLLHAYHTTPHPCLHGKLAPNPRVFQGIEPEDAVYLPAVETALSLVHDVHPRVGEKVSVFGQGMIG